MSGLLLDEKIAALARVLEAAEIPYALGGAHAFAYYGTPRATADIDLNLFIRSDQIGRLLPRLQDLGISLPSDSELRRVRRDGQLRLFWDATPIDLFFSYDALHDSALERKRRVDFGGDRIHVLSAEDLVLFKLIFDRAKDWRDIAEIVFVCGDSLDFDYVFHWLERLDLGDPTRIERMRRLVDSRGSDSPEVP